MSKTYKWDDKHDPRKDTQKAKQGANELAKMLGRSTKQFWRNIQDKE